MIGWSNRHRCRRSAACRTSTRRWASDGQQGIGPQPWLRSAIPPSGPSVYYPEPEWTFFRVGHYDNILGRESNESLCRTLYATGR